MQEVTGSTPVSPTKRVLRFFVLCAEKKLTGDNVRERVSSVWLVPIVRDDMQEVIPNNRDIAHGKKTVESNIS